MGSVGQMGELNHAMTCIQFAMGEAATKGERVALLAARDVIARHNLPAITEGRDAVSVHELRRLELATVDAALAGSIPSGVGPLDHVHEVFAKWVKEMILRS